MKPKKASLKCEKPRKGEKDAEKVQRHLLNGFYVAAIFIFVSLFPPSFANAAISGFFYELSLPPVWTVTIIAILFLAAYFILFFLLTGLRSGVNPAPEPATEMVPEIVSSPAEAGFLFRLEYDDSCLVAALIHLAQQKVISISSHHLGWMFHRESPCPGTVAPEERFIFKALFQKGQPVLLEKNGGGDFRQIKRAFRRFMNRHYGRNLAKTRMTAFIPGVILAGLGGIAVSRAPGASMVHILVYGLFAAAILFTGAFLVVKPTSYANRGNAAAESLRQHLTATRIPATSPEETLRHFYTHLPHAIALDAARWWITRNCEALYSAGTNPAQIETEWYSNGEKGLHELVSLVEDLLKALAKMP